MKNEHFTNAGGINITYYTDPLCCWSWALEPDWQHFLNELGTAVTYRYCMAGLIPDWQNYHDETFSVSRPAQMGPLWMHASQVSGRYMHDRLWIEDPPASSYPACVAVKCASLQSFQTGEKYLSAVRQAVMADGINVAKAQVLTNIAAQLACGGVELNTRQFEQDLYNGNGLNAFKQDVQEVQYKRINRYPALLVTGDGRQPMIYSGYQSCGQLLKELLVKQL